MAGIIDCKPKDLKSKALLCLQSSAVGRSYIPFLRLLDQLLVVQRLLNMIVFRTRHFCIQTLLPLSKALAFLRFIEWSFSEYCGSFAFPGSNIVATRNSLMGDGSVIPKRNCPRSPLPSYGDIMGIQKVLVKECK